MVDWLPKRWVMVLCEWGFKVAQGTPGRSTSLATHGQRAATHTLTAAWERGLVCLYDPWQAELMLS